MRRLFSALLLCFMVSAFSGSAFAATVGPVNVAAIIVVDTSIDQFANTGVILVFSAQPMTTNCSKGNKAFVAGGSADNIKNILNTATAAKLAGRPLYVLWDGCSGTGTTGYPRAMGLALL